MCKIWLESIPPLPICACVKKHVLCVFFIDIHKSISLSVRRMRLVSLLSVFCIDSLRPCPPLRFPPSASTPVMFGPAISFHRPLLLQCPLLQFPPSRFFVAAAGHSFGAISTLNGSNDVISQQLDPSAISWSH